MGMYQSFRHKGSNPSTTTEAPHSAITGAYVLFALIV